MEGKTETNKTRKPEESRTTEIAGCRVTARRECNFWKRNEKEEINTGRKTSSPQKGRYRGGGK